MPNHQERIRKKVMTRIPTVKPLPLLVMMILRMLKKRREIKVTREVAEVAIEEAEAALLVTEKVMNTMTISHLENTNHPNKEKTVTTNTAKRRQQCLLNKTQCYQHKLRPRHSKDGETFNSENNNEKSFAYN